MITINKLGLSVLLSFLLTVNCTANKNNGPKEGDSVTQKVYVDQVVSEESISKEEDLQVTVKGNLPSPAYKFDRFDVKVKGKTIEVTPLAEYDSTKMAAQVLVPYEEVCRVKDLEPGTYELKVHGRNETVAKSEKITVKEQ